jgi:hypothetical protein
MTDAGGWPGDDTAETELMALSPAERQVLAALAIVGHASLSASELAALLEVEDVAPLLDDLERRGLVKARENKRYGTLGSIGEEIRKTDAALASGDRLLKYMATLAKGGSLTPERLVEDAEAILGLSRWAAEAKQWAALLDLVKTLQACFGVAHRVQEWLELLERGRKAAQALGDRKSEVWVLQQLATASASAGDHASAQRYVREADQLQRGPRTSPPHRPEADRAFSAGRQAVSGRGMSRLGLWIVGLVVAAGTGIGAGYAIGNEDGNVGVTTVPVSVTVTIRGRTLRTSDTVTLPATTVVTTKTELTTTTEPTTVTTTTTVTAGIG